jgi:transcription antitermination protein NusB
LKPRRQARIVALQALFEVDTVGHEPGAALVERLAESPLNGPSIEFCRGLLFGAWENKSVLDAVIHRIAPEWPIDQMAPIDRSILRLAAFEILLSSDTPPKVAINEAVELAKTFGSDSSSRFVNGVLGTLLAQRQELLPTLRLPPSAT